MMSRLLEIEQLVPFDPKTMYKITLALIFLATSGSFGSDEHTKALKDLVPDHPHLHELVDRTHKDNDLDAKHEFEKAALSVRFNQTKSALPSDTDDEHVVLEFLDNYSADVTGSSSVHQFRELEPLISMLGKDDDLKKRLVELGKMLERAECDFACLGDHLTNFMNDSIERLLAHSEL